MGTRLKLIQLPLFIIRYYQYLRGFVFINHFPTNWVVLATSLQNCLQARVVL